MSDLHSTQPEETVLEELESKDEFWASVFCELFNSYAPRHQSRAIALRLAKDRDWIAFGKVVEDVMQHMVADEIRQRPDQFPTDVVARMVDRFAA